MLNNLNNKKKYIEWMYSNFNNSSGTISSYIRAIEILSKVLDKDIFSIIEVETLNELYSDLLDHQRDENGKYFYKEAQSYGKKGFYSAAIYSLITFYEKNNIVKE